MILTTDSPLTLIIREQGNLQLEGFSLQVQSYIGRLADVHYFRVEYNIENETRIGLLRIGSVGGGLNRELEIRKSLGTYKLIPDLLVSAEIQVQIVLGNNSVALKDESQDSHKVSISVVMENEVDDSVNISDESKDVVDDSSEDSGLSPDASYLDEAIEEDNSSQLCIVALGDLPNEAMSFEHWLNQEHSAEEILPVIGLICQVFRYVQQRGWCFVQVFPSFIQVEGSVKFFDLTGVYPESEKLKYGLMGYYCPPEIAYSSHPIDEKVSSYVVGALLYHAFHHKPPTSENCAIAPIPKIYQLLKTCLASASEDRYPLAQLVSVIVELRQTFKSVEVKWEIATRSTVGLIRSGNEDNYGVRQEHLGTSEPLLLGVVADGMGGEAHGEIASKLAVETIVQCSIPTDLSTPEKKTNWLLELVERANEEVSKNAQGGSTTLSVVLVIGRELAIAHVGDSRIFLLRNGCICQISEDHSFPALLLASGKITYEESLTHPDKNQLTKYIGSKRTLSEGYVQDLSHFSSDMTLILEDQDILILCSDGVWDLVPSDELAEIFFIGDRPLQTNVNQVIDLVLNHGAHDNATVLAIKLTANSRRP